MEYESIRELVERANERNTSIGRLVLADQAEEMDISEEECLMDMDRMLIVMEESVAEGLDPELRSTSGLTGGDAYRLWAYTDDKDTTGHPIDDTVLGGFMSRVVARALAVAEYNAAMGRIVAAPTAGASGIMPGCLVGLLEEKAVPRRTVLEAMFTAAAFGMVIAKKASLAGASGGCQAECGSAAGMTAAAIAEALGGTPEMAETACAMALKNQLGLVCDPVAGLVEIPCIKRNAAGAAIACTAADMALAGIVSRIPADEVIAAMKESGDALPASLRETGTGGLAATPTGVRIREALFGKNR